MMILGLFWSLMISAEEVAACHTTRIYIQNGTWLDTAKWLQNGFFGGPDILPVTGPVLPSKTTTPTNPVAGNVAHIPNRDQDCICGAISVSGRQEKEEPFQVSQMTQDFLDCRLINLPGDGPPSNPY